MTRKFNKQKGFTLIETFVAVLILVFAVIAPLGLLARAISDGNFAKNQVTAYFLAQEGVELAIRQRDKNTYTSGPDIPLASAWLDGLSICQSQGCNPDPKMESFTSCSETDFDEKRCILFLVDDELGYSPAQGTATGNESMFARRIKVNEVVDDPNKVEIVSEVRWSEKNKTHSSRVATVMINPLSVIDSGGDEGEGGGDGGTF